VSEAGDDCDERLKVELETARQDLENVDMLFIGLDCGKSGLNGVMAPRVIRQTVMKKAEAEAELAKVHEWRRSHHFCC
jgi:hypothetical protein